MSDKTVTLDRDCEALLVPQATPTSVSAGTRVRILQSVGSAHTVMTDRCQVLRIDAKDSDALGVDPPPKPKTSPAAGTLFDQCMEELKTCYDPELPVNIYDLGLIYEVEATADGIVDINMTLTTPGCPVAQTFPGMVESRVAEDVEGVTAAHVELVWDPPWTPDLLTDEVKLDLGLL